MHAGTAGENERMGPAWWYGVLPFLGERNRYDKIQATQRFGQAAVPFNAQGISTALGPELLASFKPAWLHCPASPLPVMERPSGPIALPTYVGIAGGCDIREDSPDYQAVPGTPPGLLDPKRPAPTTTGRKGRRPRRHHDLQRHVAALPVAGNGRLHGWHVEYDDRERAG